MHIKKIFLSPKAVLVNRIIIPFYSLMRILKYKLLSTGNITGKPILIGPALIKGSGKVIFQQNVTIGVVSSPAFFSSYTYIEARNSFSVISIGANTYINNNACFISEGEGIFVGDNVLIGNNFTVFDSDFHSLHPSHRTTGTPKTAQVTVDNNVFIGAHVTILKGVQIGENTVIASNSVVTQSIPANVIAGGNPCRVFKEIEL